MKILITPLCLDYYAFYHEMLTYFEKNKKKIVNNITDAKKLFWTNWVYSIILQSEDGMI